MREKLRNYKADFILTSLIYIILGVLFIAYKDRMADILGISVAVILIVIGVIGIACYCFKLQTNVLLPIVGVIVIIFGIVIFAVPSIVPALVPIFIGALTIVFGIRGMKVSVDALKCGTKMDQDSKIWLIGFITSAVSIVMGVFFILFACKVIEIAMAVVSVLIGIGMIFNGVSNIWAASHASYVENNYRKYTKASEVIEGTVEDKAE